MKLVKGKTYTAPNSTLRVEIHEILDQNEEYTEFRGLVISRYGFIENNYFTVYHSKISHWEEV
jgi:phage anti-repressor protein